MAGVIQKPDALSLSGNLKPFVIITTETVSFVLKKGEVVLLQQSYEPGPGNRIEIDIKEVVTATLLFQLNASQLAYIQPDLVANFTAKIGDTDYPFRVIRGGVSNLVDTAANWLKLHFLTWQPRVKDITYYSPEWLTYYAVDACSVKLKATYPDKTSRVITLHSCPAGTAVTLNVQYSVIAGKLGKTYPSYYEVWTETSGGAKLSETQVYAFSEILSEDEQWYIFENSLGGLDTFRAYGTNNLNAEHEHNVAEFGDVRGEYQIDTERKYIKNTGYMDEYARRWLLDFFPSRAKYVYEATAIRKIVVTESNVAYISNDLPSSYTFTWQLAEVSALLNLVKNESDIPDNLVAPDLSSPDFILPPRLAEFPRVQLTEGVLIPAFDPHNPKPTVTTFGAIHDTIKNAVIKELEDELAGIGGGGDNPGGGSDIEIIESTDEETIPTDDNLYSALKSWLEDQKIRQELDGKYLRKDKPDWTEYLLGLLGGATFGDYVGGFLGSGGIFDKDGRIEANSLTLREFLEVPELRFNRIDVVSGELWNAIAFGLIEEVDEVNRIAKLKLEEGELSGLHVNDFCRGIFHNLTDNDTIPGTDSAGFEVMLGFRTAYFTPVEIIDNATFRYELKPGSTVHPCKAMKFTVYGNPVEKNRQASAYHTRTYTRYLRGVDTWKIEPDHISMQLGDLSNLIINGESLAEGSVYLNNVYLGGNIRNVGGLDSSLKGKDAYSVTLSTYSAVFNTKEGLTEQATVVSGGNTVVTGSDTVTTSNFLISTRIQATKGPELLRYSTVVGEGKYVVSATGTGCTFTVTDGMIVVHGVTEEKAEIKIDVNCEGLAVYEQVFTIVSVVDGIDGTDIEWIYCRTATEAQKPAKPTRSDNVDDYIPDGWTDDPAGTTIALPYEWSCKREKKKGVWGAFSDVFLWLKFGKDGKEIEYIYRRTPSASRPSTPGTYQEDDFVPPGGWTDDPVGPDSSYPYEWVSNRKKVNSVWGSFSTPALSAKYSFDGKPGTPGAPGVGTPGKDGIQGPGLNYIGDWSSTVTYYKNNSLVDIVSIRDSSDNPTYYVLQTSSSRNQYPGSYPSVWQVQNSFKNVATDVLFAKKATIAGWTYSNYYIYSNTLSACLNGSDSPSLPLLAVGLNGGIDSRGLIPDPSSPGGYKVNPKAALKIYRSGILTVGEGIEESNAGISGVGSPAATPAPVRFWAGTTYENSRNAPFRVDHYGNLVANNCNLTGSFQTSAAGKSAYINIDPTHGAVFGMRDANSNSVLSIFGPSLNPATINVKNGDITSIIQGHQFGISSPKGDMHIMIVGDGFISFKANKWPTYSARLSVGELYQENGYIKVKTQ